MPATPFFVNNAMICHNCRRVCILRLMESWRDVSPIGNELEVLDPVLVSCGMCLEIPHVHDPVMSICTKFVDPQPYESVINTLAKFTGCTPSISTLKQLQLRTLKIKSSMRIREPNDMFAIRRIPDANMMIIEHGAEVKVYPRFFRHDPPIVIRNITRYPEASNDIKNFNVYGPMPFAFMKKKFPFSITVDDESLAFCPGCLNFSRIENELPMYTQQTET